MGQAERVEVVEYTDVMCSWAWGSERKTLRLPRRKRRGDEGWNALKRIAAGASAAEKLALFSGPARRAYRLD